MTTDGGPAFPLIACVNGSVVGEVGGVSKRELFAAFALGGLLAAGTESSERDCARDPGAFVRNTAIASCRFADALIAELAKKDVGGE